MLCKKKGRREKAEEPTKRKKTTRKKERRIVRLVRIERPSETGGHSSQAHVSGEGLEDGRSDVDLFVEGEREVSFGERRKPEKGRARKERGEEKRTNVFDGASLASINDLDLDGFSTVGNGSG